MGPTDPFRRPQYCTTGGITNNARFFAEILQAGPGDVWVNPMPLFHAAACVLLMLGPVQGLFTQVMMPLVAVRAGCSGGGACYGCWSRRPDGRV